MVKVKVKVKVKRCLAGWRQADGKKSGDDVAKKNSGKGIFFYFKFSKSVKYLLQFTIFNSQIVKYLSECHSLSVVSSLSEPAADSEADDDDVDLRPPPRTGTGIVECMIGAPAGVDHGAWQ
jgi:hypothetical protein